MNLPQRPVTGTEKMLAEIDRRLTDGAMTHAEHDEWQRKLTQPRRYSSRRIVRDIAFGVTIGLILVVLLTLFFIQ